MTGAGRRMIKKKNLTYPKHALPERNQPMVLVSIEHIFFSKIPPVEEFLTKAAGDAYSLRPYNRF